MPHGPSLRLRPLLYHNLNIIYSNPGPAHKNLYTVTLKLDNGQYRAEGSSIEKAQHSATAMALQHTEFKHPSPTVVLNGLAMKRRETAVYILENGGPTPQPDPGQPYYQKPLRNPFSVRLRVGGHEYPGMGDTVQAARNDAASKAIEDMERQKMNDNQQCPVINENALPPTDIGNELNIKIKSPISLVYEIALKRKLKVIFHVLSEKGPSHMKVFIMQCCVGNLTSEGEGYSKQIAKQQAAEKILQEIKKLDQLPNTNVNVNEKRQHNPINVNSDQSFDDLEEISPVSLLFQIQRANKGKAPVYHPDPGQPYYQKPLRNPFSVRLRVGGHEYPGMGDTVQAARNDAASKAIEDMERQKMNDNQQCPVINENALPPTDIGNELNIKIKSPISLVYEIALKRKLKVIFHVLSEKGPSHMKVFIMQCCVGNLTSEGEGYSKQIAKQQAAEKILQEIKKLDQLPNTNVNVNEKRQHNPINVNSDQSFDDLEEISPVSLLFQIQRANKGKAPVYHVIRERDGWKFLQFVVVASVNGHHSVAAHTYERIAKWNAAKALLALLGYTSPPKPVIESKATLGRSEMLNSGSGSAPTEVKKTGQVQTANKFLEAIQRVQVKDQLRTLHEKAALEAINVLLENNAESVYEGSTAKPQESPKAGLN